MQDDFEVSDIVAGNVRKYKRMFSENIWKQRKYKTVPEILEELDIPRFHFNNVTNPDKMTPSKNEKPYNLPIDWPQKLALVYGDFDLITEYCADVGCVCLTPRDIAELENIDPKDTERLGKVIKKLQSVVKGGR